MPAIKSGTLTITATHATREVTVNGVRLDPACSQKVWNHSPDGFNWGYGGSGPAQLALALLLAAGLPSRQAVAHHQKFKWDVIAKQQGDWTLTIDIARWLAEGGPDARD
jgi:hypothetical protein